MLTGEDQCGALLWLKWAIFGDRLLRDLREETVGLTSGLPRTVGEGIYARAHSAEEYGRVARMLDRALVKKPQDLPHLDPPEGRGRKVTPAARRDSKWRRELMAQRATTSAFSL
jgi:hypothetical protein